MKERFARLPQDLGRAGLAGLALLALFLAFTFGVVQPQEEKNARLRERLAEVAARDRGPDTAADKVAAVIRFLDRGEETTDWLAKLHGIATATGLRVRSAAYRTVSTDTRIERYEIVLPVAGNYAQIRDFLKRAAADIPVLSVDQLTLKREESTDGVLQAELRLTLHMVKS